ncbi:ATP-dependent DNA helicase [Kordiimonas pumila]|uniref:ATP-dependent RecD-like DNA helicase n=1 Tax=Kordiimonas pumila TaxID=2161677 RepID=A0ABV7D609_9PROT|nr:AAA family ATPase [Kordiimonas pumila]
MVEHGHIIGEALKADIGRMRIGDIEAALKRQERDKQYQRADYQTGGKHLYHGHTTDSSIAWETRLEDQVLKQRETVWPLASIEATQKHLENSSLTDKQKAAARFVLRSRDRSVIVAGVAGSGKSHLVRTIKKAAPYRQYLALAPTATAAVDLGTSADIPAGTLAEFLQTGGQKTGRNTILFVDESSMSSTRQTVRLLEVADRRKARIVFLGDTKQLDAIEQGKPFDLLIKMGLRSVFIDQSFRQKNPSMHTLVQAARNGKIKQVFATLGDRLGEYEAADLANQVAERWIKNPNRESIQIAALENSSRISTNAALRHRLQEEGLVSKADHPFKILSSKGLTPALLSLADYYKPGDIIVFHLGHAKLGADKDDKFRVIKSKGGEVQMERLSDGKKMTFDPGRTRKKGMTLYHEQKRNLSLGDKIQWRQNLKDVAGIKNGHTGTIEKIKDGKATIAFDHGPKRTLDLREHQCWDHGYVITTYKQQGKTTPVNWIIANTEKAGEITQKSLYVSLTRAEKSVRLFTDNARKLKHALHINPGGKTSSLQGLGTQRSLHLPISPSPTSRYTNLIDALHPALRMIAANLYDTIKDAKPRRNLTADSILMKDDKASIITAAHIAEKDHMKQHADMRER